MILSDTPFLFQLTAFRRARLVLAGVVIATLVLGLLSGFLFLIGLLAVGALLAFYNDGPRGVPQGNGLVLAPIDGILRGARKGVGLPLSFDQARDQAEHFMALDLDMGLLACRSVRAPMAGTVREILRYTPDENTNDAGGWAQMDGVALLVETPDSGEYALVLTAPLIPRQVELNMAVGDLVQAGQRIGIALFYARATVYVRDTAPLLRQAGQHVSAGETVLQAASFTGTPLFQTI